MASGGVDERVLRAKYLDWCSARLADRFMQLAPEDIYQLAQRSEDTGAVSPGAGGAGEFPGPNGTPGSGSYRAVVERVTAALASELELPDYAEWRLAYEASPERYERELLGLWEEEFAGRE